jgi:hypothetical protein
VAAYAAGGRGASFNVSFPNSGTAAFTVVVAAGGGLQSGGGASGVYQGAVLIAVAGGGGASCYTATYAGADAGPPAALVGPRCRDASNTGGDRKRDGNVKCIRSV